MAAPRPALNATTTSVGITTKLVTVQSISADGNTAICVDRMNTQTTVSMLVQRSKGVLPAVGETWLVTQDLGAWTFAAFVAGSTDDFQTVPSSSGVYAGATAPGTPSVGELWVNSSLSNIVSVWNGTQWEALQFGAIAIQPGSLTGAQLADEANIAASQVNFTASDIGGVTTTISATAPSSPSYGDLWYDAENGYQLNQWTGTQWVPYQWGTQAIAARSVTTQLLAAQAVTADEMAAGIVYAGIINGTIVDAATFIGSTFEGTDFLINGAGAFFYNNTPGLGDLFVTITSQPGTDEVGNPYEAGIFLYGPSGSFAAMVDNGSEAALLLNPPGATHLTWSPQAFAFTNGQGGTQEVTWLVLTSGKESNHDDAAIQLYSESADGSVAAHMIVEFGGTVFAEITKTGIVLPGGGTPPAVAGSASVYATTAGTLQVVDGVDGESYGTQRRSLVTNSNQVITNAAGYGSISSSAVGQRTYRVHAQYFLQTNSTANGIIWAWFGPTGTTGMISFTLTDGLDIWSMGGIQMGNEANAGQITFKAGDIYVLTLDGSIVCPTSGTFSVQAAAYQSGDTYTVLAHSFLDIMPV